MLNWRHATTQAHHWRQIGRAIRATNFVKFLRILFFEIKTNLLRQISSYRSPFHMTLSSTIDTEEVMYYVSKRKTITDHVSFQYSAFFRSLIPRNWAYVMDERARAVQFCVVQLRSFNDYRDRKMTRSTRAQRIQHVVRHVVIKGRGNHSKIGRRTKI